MARGPKHPSLHHRRTWRDRLLSSHQECQRTLQIITIGNILFRLPVPMSLFGPQTPACLLGAYRSRVAPLLLPPRADVFCYVADDMRLEPGNEHRLRMMGRKSLPRIAAAGLEGKWCVLGRWFDRMMTCDFVVLPIRPSILELTSSLILSL